MIANTHQSESDHLVPRLRNKNAKEHLEMVQDYSSHFNDTQPHDQKYIKKRKENANMVTNHYYNLVTDFYEYGWSQSFHFARMFQEYGFMDCIRLHEHYLALKLGLDASKRVLDLGCGGNK